MAYALSVLTEASQREKPQERAGTIARYIITSLADHFRAHAKNGAKKMGPKNGHLNAYMVASQKSRKTYETTAQNACNTYKTGRLKIANAVEMKFHMRSFKSKLCAQNWALVLSNTCGLFKPFSQHYIGQFMSQGAAL